MAEFVAMIEAAGRGGHFVVVPEDVVSAIGGKHLLRVKGTLAATPYRSNLARMGDTLYLGVHKSTIEAASKQTGDCVSVTIELDPEPR